MIMKSNLSNYIKYKMRGLFLIKNFPVDLFLIFVLSVSFCIIYYIDFVFGDLFLSSETGKKIGSLLVNLSLSYIAAYFFYLLTFVVPKSIERQHLKEHIAHLLHFILFYLLMIMQGTTTIKRNSKPGEPFDSHDTQPFLIANHDRINVQWFSDHAKDVYMSQTISRSRKDGSMFDVGDNVTENIKVLNRTIDDLLRYSRYIDPDLISLIISAYRNIMVASWINGNNFRKQYRNKEFHSKRDASIYSKGLFEYFEIYTKCETILLTRYSKTTAARKQMDLIAGNKAKIKEMKQTQA